MALIEVLERQVRPGGAAPIRAAFTLADAAALRALVAEAGFCAVRIRMTTNLIRYPSLEEYVLGYLSATPIARDIAAMDDADRAALLQEVTIALREYVDDDGLAAPTESHVVLAQT